MPAKTDVIRGAIKVGSLLEEACVTDWPSAVKAIAAALSIEVPATVSNVTIGPSQPGDSERQNLWVRTDNSSDFVGLYIYALGQWRQIYPVPMEMIWIADAGADSRAVPEGYTLATEAGRLDESQKTWLKAQWHWHDDVVDSYYDIFSVYYTGF